MRIVVCVERAAFVHTVHAMAVTKEGRYGIGTSADAWSQLLQRRVERRLTRKWQKLDGRCKETGSD